MNTLTAILAFAVFAVSLPTGGALLPVLSGGLLFVAVSRLVLVGGVTC